MFNYDEERSSSFVKEDFVEHVVTGRGNRMDDAEHSHRGQLRVLLQRNSKIPARLVESLMSSGDREEQADAYYCLSENWEQIHPEMERWFTAPFVIDFLFRSIFDPHDNNDVESNVLSPYDAAGVILGILRSWVDRPDEETRIPELIKRIDDTILSGNQSARDCLETGFLEHALESPNLRPLFSHWSDHPELREAYFRALEWGRGHERDS